MPGCQWTLHAITWSLTRAAGADRAHTEEVECGLEPEIGGCGLKSRNHQKLKLRRKDSALEPPERAGFADTLVSHSALQSWERIHCCSFSPAFMVIPYSAHRKLV